MTSQLRKRNAERHLSRIIDQYRKDIILPAVGAGLVIKDELVASYVGGVRKFDADHKTQPDDLFQLASITKPLTGYLVARLIELGYFGWLTTIGTVHGDIIEWLDEKNGDKEKGWTNHYRNTTITDLMTHTSGITWIFHNAGDLSVEQKLAAIDPDLKKNFIKKRKFYTQLFLQQRPFWGWKSLNGGPLEKYASGPVIVASMAERRLGMPWEFLMEYHVFKPLGITHYAFGPMSSPTSITNTWQHQLLQNGQIQPTVHPNMGAHWAWAESAVGAIGLSVGDLAKWIAAIITNPKGLLSKTVWEGYVSAPPGLGFSRGGWGGGNGRLDHNGSNGYSYARAIIDLNTKLGMFACTNMGSDEATRAVNELCAELEVMGLSWEAFDFVHMAVDFDKVEVSADSVLNNMTGGPLMSDGMFRTMWASAIDKPTLTVELDQPRMLKGVVMCQGVAPRIEVFELEIDSGEPGAMPLILSGQPLDNQTVSSANGFVIRTFFTAPTKTKTLKIRITQSSANPRIARLLLLEYEWAMARDLDIDASGQLWVVDAEHRVLTSESSVEKSWILLSQFSKGAAVPGQMVRRAKDVAYMLDHDRKVWRGIPDGWTLIYDPMESKRIAADDANNNVWSIDTQFRVRRHDGKNWIQYPGDMHAIDLCVRNGTPYVIGTDSFIHRGTANGWQKLSGSSSPQMVRLAVGENGKHWAISKDNKIFSYDGATDKWVEHPGGGKGTAIAVYKTVPYVIGMAKRIWKSTGNGWTRLNVLQEKSN